MKAILATRAGRCTLCDQRIEEDDLIVLVDDEWVHADCADEDER